MSLAHAMPCDLRSIKSSMSNSVMCMTCCKFNEDRNKGKYRLVQNSDVFICCHTIILYLFQGNVGNWLCGPSGQTYRTI